MTQEPGQIDAQGAPDATAQAEVKPAAGSGAVVRARQLSFSFGEDDLQKQVLFDVCLDVHAGEIVLLSGPSGSGKTTLLTLIGGLRTVRRGRLSVLGLALEGAGPAELVALRRRIGFIFQAHNLLDFLTAQQNVAMMFELHPEVGRREAWTRAGDMLAMVGLGHRRDYKPGHLSGGQRQRVAIARALVSRPSLILADEPTSSLDGATGREIVHLLERLAREQRCPILLVTHDARLTDLADRVVHMEDGRLTS